ncbi:MAG: radical SAM protein [Kiritimatiellaeota bacterium]|nr:radical SAM protein [Kiritimatiellota bacterium]
MKNNVLPRFMRLVHPAFIRLFFQTWRLFRHDPRCSARNLLRASRLATCDEKIIRHDGKLVYSSFLPPIPSRAAGRVLEAIDDTTGKGPFDAMLAGTRNAPVSMYVALTERCPYRCAHCSAAGRSPAPDIPTREMIKILREVQDMGTAIIGLTGGEPLLRGDLPELVAALDDRSVVFLFTSGRGLTRDMARTLKRAGLFAVGVSLDSADAAEMDALRGSPGAFEHAAAAIGHCRAAGLYTLAQTVADRGSMRSGKLLDIVKRAGELGAHEVRILENMPSGRYANITPDRILTVEERAELRRFHIEANRLRGLPKVSVFAHTEDAERFGCGAGTQHSYIDAAGNLYPCDFVPLAFGNVREQPVAVLWKAMHRAIGKPRRECMVMELYAKKLLSEISMFPVAPPDARVLVARLDPVETLPGFYRCLTGKYCP